MTYEAACDYLLALPRFSDQGSAAYRPGLENMEALMEAMDHPHKKFSSVHIAGTNGKGSTASFIAAIATACGLRTGLHTSPHLYRITERLRIDGQPAPENWLASAVSRYLPAFEAIAPSFFEATVALSFLYFAENAVDLAVVEVGMGGRLDATNVLFPRLSVITSIGLDHTEFLGRSVELIAREKAGIIKRGIPVVTGVNQTSVSETIREVANSLEAPFIDVREEVELLGARSTLQGSFLDVRTPVRTYENLCAGLPGVHQQENALTAIRAAELALDEVKSVPDCVYAGMRDVRRFSGLLGRLDIIQKEPLFVCDVSHNPEGLGVALRFVHEAIRPRKGRLFVLFGAMRDKDVVHMARLLKDADATVFLVSIDSARALTVDELSTYLVAEKVQIGGTGSVAEGLAWFEGLSRSSDGLLITGSHQIVSQLPEKLLRINEIGSR